MTLEVNQAPKSKGVKSKALASFVIAVGVMAFFGYVVGKDMALRDNARDVELQVAN